VLHHGHERFEVKTIEMKKEGKRKGLDLEIT